ncbi:TorCAD operon transcriptional regulatory protein TorR [Rhizobium sp. CECT 9324]|nr:TorCAD operon transcriptional regulatory protein TorR [Rhizobium sp. CECT 9324]
MHHVLVLESEDKERTDLRSFLQEHGMRVTLMGRPDQLKRVLLRESVDAILIDVVAPAGFQLVREMSTVTDAPILILSNRLVTEDDRVCGLDVGAVDYISEPFGSRELVARLKVAMRERSQTRIRADRKSYSFSGYHLLVQQRILSTPTRGDMKLTPAELNLLTAFLDAPRQILSRERLLSASRVRDLRPNFPPVFERVLGFQSGLMRPVFP